MLEEDRGFDFEFTIFIALVAVASIHHIVAKRFRFFFIETFDIFVEDIEGSEIYPPSFITIKDSDIEVVVHGKAVVCNCLVITRYIFIEFIDLYFKGIQSVGDTERDEVVVITVEGEVVLA